MKILKNTRLLFSIASLVICLLTTVNVFADESAKTEYLDGKVSESNVDEVVAQFVGEIKDLGQLKKYELEVINGVNLPEYFTDFVEVVDENGLGKFNKYDIKDVTTIDENTINIEVSLKFENREIICNIEAVSFSSLGNMLYPAGYEFEQGESFIEEKKDYGEIMMGATVNTIIGMGTVFVVLILISLLISCFKFIPKIQAFFEKKEVKEENSVQTTAEAVEDITDNMTDDLELVAVIAAAIAAAEQTTTDGFVVRSIRRR